MQDIPLLVIVGETASGKSALALELAKILGGEIICADSWTVRREVNIGTAKPSTEERSAVQHHLLDVVGPCEDFTAAVFKDLALQAIDSIAGRDKLPIMVGGTGLYIDGIIYDFGFLPEGDRAARASLNSLENEEIIAQIQATGIELGDVDQRNKRRLIRLLETHGVRPSRDDLRANTLLLGLKVDRETLQARVTARVDAMLEAGLEQEVHELAARYGWQCEALKGIGYAQWRDYFSGSVSYPETRHKIIKATLDLAKRQRTWFRRNKSIQWLNTPIKAAEVVELITSHMDKSK